MKRFVSALCILFLLIYCSFLSAHPAEDIIFKYDARYKVLSVGIAHDTKDLNKHYISKINIKVNGALLIAQSFKLQVDLKTQAVGYAMVELKKGDTLEILAICSNSGKLSKQFKIE